jgi:tRNA(His) 5'-end guanylyltransferase
MSENNNLHVPYVELQEEANRYEELTKKTLVFKMPVFVRITGKSFKTFTKGFRKPYDSMLIQTMQQTLVHLCAEIQGCVFGYVAADEMTLVLADWHKWNSVPWLNYNVQKICSNTASDATAIFNRVFNKNKEKFYCTYDGADKEKLYAAYNQSSLVGARFTATCFNVPIDRVCEMIYYRQLDARRTSIQSLGRAYFQRQELVGKSNDEVLEMLASQDVSWDCMPTAYRIGSACIKNTNQFSKHNKWAIDYDMPMLCEKNRDYIQRIMDSICVDDNWNDE